MIPANKGKRFPAEPLDRDVVERLLEACADDFLGRRTAAAIALMWRTGVRNGEAFSIQRHQLNLLAGTVRVVWPKGVARGKKPRTLGVDAIATGYLEAWLEARGPGELGPLFTSTAGKRVATSRMRESLPRLAESCGLRGMRVSPHMLRHTFAFECAMEGRPLPWISRCLGHASLRQTEQYLNHLAPADVIEGMRERA
jgi:integrase